MTTKSKPAIVQAPPAATTKTTKVVAKASPAKPPEKAVVPVAAPAAAEISAASLGESPLPRDEKPKKTKMVRDSFTIPDREYAQLNELKKKCLKSGVHVKKSELLRAGVLALSELSDVALIATVGRVEVIKTGRPKKG